LLQAYFCLVFQLETTATHKHHNKTNENKETKKHKGFFVLEVIQYGLFILEIIQYGLFILEVIQYGFLYWRSSSVANCQAWISSERSSMTTFALYQNSIANPKSTPHRCGYLFDQVQLDQNDNCCKVPTNTALENPGVHHTQVWLPF